MGLGLVPVSLHPDDFCFEEDDALIEFVPRICVEALGTEPACGITAHNRAVVIFHCSATSGG